VSIRGRHGLRPVVTLLLAFVVAIGAGTALGSPTAPNITIKVPSAADGQSSVSIEFTLPAKVAALDGRLLFNKEAAELIGLAPVGGGTALAPQEISNGAAFGAFGLRPSSGKTTVRLIVDAHSAGTLSFGLVIDSAADSSGARLSLGSLTASGSLRVAAGSANATYAAPTDATSPRPLRGAQAARDLVPDGVVGKMDLDLIRGGWEDAHASGAACGSAIDATADANGDGCIDAVDLQLVSSALGSRTGGALVPTADTRAAGATSLVDVQHAPNAALGANVTASTFVVTSTLDTADARNGDGICADKRGRCTLRAAITESNWEAGDNRIEFNLPGTAPVLIQIGRESMSQIQDRSGGLVVDGYTQPGSKVNTATVGSNAVPGVLLRGTGASPAGAGLRITSSFNLVRGILFNNIWRPIVLDGPDAANNRVMGNLFGYTSAGVLAPYREYAGVVVNAGAHNNTIGSPAPGDRNAAAGGTKAFYLYGPGTNNNTIQNNVMCLTQNGMTPAACATAVDMNFGPKNNLIGGVDPGERNVIGPTRLNGVEISHGWDPDGQDKSETWQLLDNRVINNWIGFRGDGAYGPLFVSGRRLTRFDSNGVNVIDGSSRNTIQGNFIASGFDGINLMTANSHANVVRNNTIGFSPRGDQAPMARYGINARYGTGDHVILGNIIRNARLGGINLLNGDVQHVRISQNVITDTAAVAIQLAAGANGGIDPPVIGSATTTRATGAGKPGATVEVFRASRGAGSSGLPVAYLGSGIVGGDGKWSAQISVAKGESVTASQIDTTNNTSELAANAVVSTGGSGGPTAPTAGFDWSQRNGSLTVDFDDTSTGNATSWSWSFGDTFGSDERNPSHAYLLPGTYEVTLTATNANGSNSLTKNIDVQTSATSVATDAFGRSTTSGWGSADLGGAYTVVSPQADYSVGGGVGRIVLPTGGDTRSALLGSVSAQTVDIKFRVAADKVIAGANTIVFVVCRRQGNSEYRPRLNFNTNGSLSVNASMVADGTESSLGSAVVVPGATQAAGAFFWVRAQCSGSNPTTIRVKAWADGAAEPGWLFTATNTEPALQGAGAVGVRAYAGSAISVAPVTLSFDDLIVSTF
jgi:CSLREA domain-containing protein